MNHSTYHVPQDILTPNYVPPYLFFSLPAGKLGPSQTFLLADISYLVHAFVQPGLLDGTMLDVLPQMGIDRGCVIKQREGKVTQAEQRFTLLTQLSGWAWPLLVRKQDLRGTGHKSFSNIRPQADSLPSLATMAVPQSGTEIAEDKL